MSLMQIQQQLLETKVKWDDNSDLVKRAVLNAFGNASITRVVCFDVGLQPSVRYFAALMAIVDNLNMESVKYIAQKPDYTDVDKAFLRHHRYRIADYPEGIYHVDGNTLVVCVNPSTQTIDATGQGPQPAMLVIYSSICTPEIFANFDRHTLSVADDPGTWSLYVRKASTGQHKYGLDNGIDYPESTWKDMSPTLVLNADLLGHVVNPLDKQIAEELIQRNLAEAVSKYGLDDEHTLRAFEDLVQLYLKEAKYSEAQVIQRRILAYNMKKYGLYHILTLMSLADRCTHETDLEIAESLLRAALRGLEEARGLNDFMTAFAARSLGNVLFEKKEYAESEGAFEKALVCLREKVLKEHRFDHDIMRGLYKKLMEAKMKGAELAESEGDAQTQMVKFMEIEALAEESGIVGRA